MKIRLYAACSVCIIFLVFSISGIITPRALQDVFASDEIAVDKTAKLSALPSILSLDNDDQRSALFRQICALKSWRVEKLAYAVRASRIGSAKDTQGPARSESARNVGIYLYFQGGPRIDFEHESHLLVNQSAVKGGRVQLSDLQKRNGKMVVSGFDIRMEVTGIDSIEALKELESELKIVSQEFSVIHRHSKEIIDKGFISDDVFDRRDLPVESSNGATPFFTVEPGIQPGIYEISGLLNPREPGWIEVRIVDLTTGSLLSKEKQEMRTSQYVGWDKDNKYLFPFNSQVTVDGAGEKKRVSVEVWFHPELERKLLFKEMEVDTWVR